MMLKHGDMNHFIFLALKNEKTNITFGKGDTFKVNLLKIVMCIEGLGLC